MSKKQRKKIRQAKFSDYQYNGSDSRYKVLFRNGDWLVIKFIHDGAFYSYCLNCREYLHATSILSNPEFITRYSPEKEFTYCPCCGSKNLKNKKSAKKKNYSCLIEEKAIQWTNLPEELKLYPYKIGKKT